MKRTGHQPCLIAVKNLNPFAGPQEFIRGEILGLSSL